MFIKRFDYDPDEAHEVSLHPNPYSGDEFGLMDVLRNGEG